MAWSTLEEEDARISALIPSPRVSVNTIGSSVQGRPLRLLRIGIPPPAVTDRAAILFVGLQHGDEPAGREALLDLAETLNEVQDASVRLRLPGTTGNYSSTPDTAALDITGDLDLRVDATLDAWRFGTEPGAISYLLAKYTTTSNQRSYTLRLSSTGTLQLVWSANGTNLVTRSATEALVPGATGRLAVRATLDVNDGASGNVTTFFTAPTIAGPWEQLGDQVIGVGTTSIFSGTAVLEIGSHTGGTAGVIPGDIHAAQVRSGIDGTIVANPDFTAQTPAAGSFADSTGKTWTIHGSAAIVDTGDPDLVDFLETYGVLIMPTLNPDGYAANDRENSDGVDINRDHITLATPEARTLAEVLGSARPLVVVDQHEGPDGLADDLEFLPPTNAQVDAGIVTGAEAIITAMEARAVTGGWSTDDYSGGTEETTLRNCGGLRLSAGVLVETDGDDDTDPGQADRLARHTAMAETALQYVVDNVTDLLDEAGDAESRVTAAGAAGDAFDLGNGTVLDPAPLGYQLSGFLPEFHFEVFNIASSGGVVSMAQLAQPVIPFLFDAEAEFTVSAGIRLVVLPGPVVVGSVEEFAAVVSGSHDMLVSGKVVTGLQTGFNPSGVDLLIKGGDVQFDATADVFATLELEVAGVDEDTGKSLFPRRPSDLLAPYGAEVFVRRGVDLGGNGELWSPLGYFGIRSVEQDDAPYGPIRLSCQDRMAGIIEARPLTPREFRRTRTVASVLAEVVGQVYPAAIIAIDDDSGAGTLGRTLVMEESRYEVLLEIADSLGKIIFWDGEGVLRLETAPDDTVPLWQVKAGRNGVLVRAGRRVTRDRVFNGVVATGEAGESDADPVRAVVVDRGPTSPTRWASIDDGGFGFVPKVYASPFIRSVGQATTTAREMLRRSLGAPYSVDFGTVVNPALRPYHPIRVTQQDGNREVHVVDRVTVPLVAGGHMTGATRETTQVVIGGLPK